MLIGYCTDCHPNVLWGTRQVLWFQEDNFGSAMFWMQDKLQRPRHKGSHNVLACMEIQGQFQTIHF